MSVEDRLAIQQLIYQYAHFIDNFEVENWVGVFTEDAFFDEREFGNGLFVGHQDIRMYGQELSETVRSVVHLMFNHLVFDLTQNSARGVVFSVCDAIMKTGDHARFHVKYEDRYVKNGHSWKIAERILRCSFPPEHLPPAREQ